jgi:serine kinase of HPr protein (carbohydrate metabolism regulator)
MRVHATAVAIGRHGVLVRGPSGSGKSDLALRLIDDGAKLIADDLVVVGRRSGSLVISGPAKLHGRMEVRGLGIVKVPAVKSARLALVVDLVGPGRVERTPESSSVTLLGMRVKALKLWAFEASAPAKLRLAVRSR